MSNISLTGTQRNSIQSLQNLDQVFDAAQQALQTGQSVNSITDNPVAYNDAAALYDRSNAIFGIKSNIDQSIQTVQTALTGASAVEGLLQQLQGIVSVAQGGTLSQQVAATQAFQSIGQQIGAIVGDTSYQGINLLNSISTTLTTKVGTGSAATLNIQGYNLTANAASSRGLFTGVAAFAPNGQFSVSAVLGNGTVSISGFSALSTLSPGTVNSIIGATENRIGAAISQVQGVAASLGTNVGLLQAQSNFSNAYANNLETGGNALTLADLNTEAAITQATTLRQNFTVQSLEASNRQNQAILTLLKGP